MVDLWTWSVREVLLYIYIHTNVYACYLPFSVCVCAHDVLHESQDQTGARHAKGKEEQINFQTIELYALQISGCA